MKRLDLTNKFGSKVRDEMKEIMRAMLVKIPNRTVGKKLERAKIEKPIAIVAAV